jgi:hypothetical protein
VSYDVYVEMDAGGPEPMFVDLGNMTSNVSGIWKKAMYGTGVADFDGKEARECVNVLERLRDGFLRYPRATVRVSR